MKLCDLMTMCISYIYALFASLMCTMFICKSFLCHGHIQFTTSTYVLYHFLQIIEVCETSEQSFDDDCPSASSGSESVSGANISSDSTPNVDNELRTLCVLLLTLKSSFNLSEACFRVILLLLMFSFKIILHLVKVDQSEVKHFLDSFPKTEYTVRTFAGMEKSDHFFTNLVCCRECYTLYPEIDKWNIYRHSKPEDFLCEHVQFPRHTQVARRTKCNTREL